MIGFFNPYWLYGLFALIIPILIHFWNKKPAENIEIGSIFLLGAAERSSLKRGMFNQLWLLLLRCLVISVFALLFVRLYVNRITQSETPEKWVLIQSPVNAYYNGNRHNIDSLIKQGYTAHAFSSGFAEINLEKVLVPGLLKSKKLEHEQGQFWLLLSKIDTLKHRPVEVHLYSDNQLGSFSGLRPTIRYKLHWHITQPTDSSFRQLRSAYKTFSGKTECTMVFTSPRSTRFQTAESVTYLPSETNPIVSKMPDRIPSSLQAKTADLLSLNPDSLSYRIAIYYDPDKINDAAYAAAAFRAAREFTKRKLIISLIKLDPDKKGIHPAQTHATGILWLSYLSLPLRLSVDKTVENIDLRFLIKYEKSEELLSNTGQFRQISASIADTVSNSQQIFQPLITGNIELRKLYISKNSGETRWVDNAGNQVLSLDPILQPVADNKLSSESKPGLYAPLRIYRFYSRFDSRWNSLVWSADFPQFLVQLLSNIYPHNNFIDKRVISLDQLLPVTAVIPEVAHNQLLPGYKFDLFPFLFALLIILFIAERWLSYV